MPCHDNVASFIPVAMAGYQHMDIKAAGLNHFSWVVDAADRELALQALLLDPMMNDIDQARAILDDFLTTFAEYLPQFA